jgi:4-hydroxybenzoate polyprenyltransferase
MINDLADVEADRRHPSKRHRPLAAGLVRPGHAAAAAVGLIVAAAALAALLPLPVRGLAAVYLANSLAYCFALKTQVIADVLSIACGFVVRLLAGCYAVGLEPSSWLVVCGFSLALVLGFGKRRAEAAQLTDEEQVAVREVLGLYTRPALDTLLGAATAVCLLSYMLYTVAPDTVARHGTERLIYTVPFVAYGLFRYILRAQQGYRHGPTEILTGDPTFVVTGALWAGSVVFILYVLPKTAPGGAP